MRRIFTFLLTALGFSAMVAGCEIDNGGGLMMYGTPSADYEVKGAVTNQAGNPIEGIAVQIARNNAIVGYYPAVYTDAEGKYDVQTGRNFPENSIQVLFSDVDEEQNGGWFEEQLIDIPIDNKDYVGGGEWYKGKVTKSLDVVMTLKSNEE